MSKKSSKFKPLKKTLFFLDNKYKFEIIYCLSIKKMRFGELKKYLENITQQLLTKQLKEMEKNNLINRKEYSQFPKKVEYSLTSFGLSLKPLIDSMQRWEKNNVKKINNLLKKNLLDSIYDYY